jgi:hypothetical protein
MVCTISLDDRVMPYHPIEHSDTIHILEKLYYTPISYPKDINRLNQTRAHLCQEAYIYLSKTPKPNLPIKGVPLPNLYL